MKNETDIRETIPRLQQLVPHKRDQLISLRNGATFENARLRYGTTVDRLVAQGLGRRTVSRVGDKDRYWAPTREVLDEAMRLEFVERQQLPSARKYLDAHRAPPLYCGTPRCYLGTCRVGPGNFTPSTGSPEAVTRLRLPQNVACGFPALRSSERDSQHSECLDLPVWQDQAWSLQRPPRPDKA